MLPVLSILVGVSVAITFSFWLWYMIKRPAQWAQRAEKLNTFWPMLGIPQTWTNACLEFETGRGQKALVASGILFALVLPFTAFFIYHHG